MFQDFGSSFLGGFQQGSQLAQQALLNALRRDQLEVDKAQAEASIANANARTQQIESDLALRAGQQTTALQTLLGLEGDFQSEAARSFFNRVGRAEDPFADATILSQAPTVLQEEARTRIFSQAVGGPDGANAVVERAEPGDLSLQGFLGLAELADLGDEETERHRKRLFPTEQEIATEREAIADKNLNIARLGLASAALVELQEGNLTFNQLAQTQNPILVGAVQTLFPDIGADIRQFRRAAMDRFNISAEIDKSLRNAAIQLLRDTNTVGQFPIKRVMRFMVNPGSLSGEELQSFAPIQEQLELRRTSFGASIVATAQGTPEQKVLSAMLTKALEDGDVDLAQRLARQKNSIASQRFGPEISQFFPTFQTEPTRFGFLPGVRDEDITGIVPSLPLSPVEQSAFMLMEAAQGNAAEAIVLLRQRFGTVENPTAEQQAAFDATLELLRTLGRGAQPDDE